MRRALAALLAAAISGCASQAYDPTPAADRPLRERTFDSSLDVEESYRVLYRQLEQCAGVGYHVQPRFERDTGRAWVMVVSGIGLDRYSFLGNRFEGRFQIQPAPVGSQVVVTWSDVGLTPLVESVPGWLDAGLRGCGD